MNPLQSLEMLDRAAALAPLNRADQMRALKAAEDLRLWIKERLPKQSDEVQDPRPDPKKRKG